MKETMNKPNLKELADLLNQALEDKVGIVHIFDPDFPKGGLTVAFRKSNEFRSGCMVDVAVATCSQEDSFNKRIGNMRALKMFYNGETISLPLLKSFTAENINYAVKCAFKAMYDEV